MSSSDNLQTKVKQVSSGISIKNTERVFIAGKTGSGKTTLAETMLFPVDRLIYIDSKDGVDSKANNLVNLSESAKNRILNGDKIRVRVVQNEDAYECLELAYRAGNIYILVDELTALVSGKTTPEKEFMDIWTRGRSRKIGAWALTQRPSSIPLITISEAEHFFCFQLNLEDDRKRMAQVMGKEVNIKPVPKKYSFYYKNIDDNKLLYFTKISLG